MAEPTRKRVPRIGRGRGRKDVRPFFKLLGVERCARLRAWYGWYHQALGSYIPPLVRFTQRLRHCLPGILVHCRWPLDTNLVEVINNKIMVIKHMATASTTMPTLSSRSGPPSPE